MKKRLRTLIVTGFNSLEGFQLPMENRTLLWGLDQYNIEWFLYRPWEPPPDLSRFDAVLITVYRAHIRNFAHHARQFETLALKAGIPVIGTTRNIEGLHSFYLAIWQKLGIPCARFQRFRTAEDLTLDTYPMILRRDGIHRGGTMILVHNREEAEQAIATQHAQCPQIPSATGPQPLDLAIAFVETVKSDGYYAKWRCYVVGDEVIPAHFMRSRAHFVNYKDAALWANTCNLDEIYRHEGVEHPEQVLAAAKSLGFDIITLDYSLLDDGRYIFWEGNRIRATAGDQHVGWISIRDTDLQYGEAVARLIRRQVAGHIPETVPSKLQALPVFPDATCFVRQPARYGRNRNLNMR
ncbi:MAG: hypothetical protein HQL75_13275 [Magnetococcales bacterium]|nr:hypothetical protein [Magnetococcales bacterium]